MDRNVFNAGRIVLTMTSTLVLVGVFPWTKPAIAQTLDSGKPVAASAPAAATGEVWAATAAVPGKPADLGKVLGQKLKEACKDRQPDLVLVGEFLWLFKTDEERQQVLDGVAGTFDKQNIYGNSFGPMSDLGGGGSVVAMALGGMRHTAVTAKIEKGKEEEAYKTLAESLKGPYTEAAGKGRLILILGSCSKTTNAKAIAEVFQSVLGKEVPLFGLGTPGVAHFVRGVVQENSLTAILLTGNFTCDFATAAVPPAEQGGHLDTAKILESAEKGMAAAIGEKKDNVAAILAGSFTTRGHTLEREKAKREEVSVTEAAKATTGALLFVWHYGSEIAPPRTGEPAVAQQDPIAAPNIMVCVIRKAVPPSGK